ncbi:MBL fold metallo-hydrolase [Paenibacillus xerothermodurans]|uniref:MBL fold metallo-hydrolase n=1 Tax=Paenibacillus xerothermodurans TaxID=1977292 RepID=A0A2W1NUE1_PAEXE|nr:MBL fold metallo-hydrolase [Paenibacillus xerothermodurans]PZE22273.1 MBL fold metallo-hydrolase [Paenibacillus xerothermodurans]
MPYPVNVRTGEALIREIDATRAPAGMLAIWFLGQASVIIKGGDTVVYIDPYLSESPHRAFPPPLTPEQMTNATYCLITHEHTDHLDADTIAKLAAAHQDIVYMAPGVCRESLLQLGVSPAKLHAARTDEWWEASDVRIKPVPAAHEQLEYDAELGHRFVGYILELNGVTLYHAGDTTVYPGLAESLQAESLDIALLPINGRDAFRTARNIIGNMNYREAAELAAAAQIDTVVPLHYDMFAGNAENPGYFVDHLYKHFPTQKSHVMARFERYIYVSAAALL